jgi:hypothetical protein
MDDIRTTLLLSVQRALLGAVSARVRAVTCDRKEAEIKLQFLFDGDIDEADRRPREPLEARSSPTSLRLGQSTRRFAASIVRRTFGSSRSTIGRTGAPSQML